MSIRIKEACFASVRDRFELHCKVGSVSRVTIPPVVVLQQQFIKIASFKINLYTFVHVHVQTPYIVTVNTKISVSAAPGENTCMYAVDIGDYTSLIKYIIST